MGPVLIFADEAARLAGIVAAARPDERLLPVAREADLDAALAEGPEVAFAVKSPALGAGPHARLVACPSLRWLQVGGSGYEHLGDWDRERLTVTNSVGVLAPFLAETCIGAMLALNHKLLAYRDQQARREWMPRPFRPLSGQRMLIVGAGAIGGELAWRAAALGLEVIAIRASGAPVRGAAEVRPPGALMASLGEADIVSVHLRVGPETEGLFDATAFAAMKPGALFLNSARGAVVVEADLAAALASGHLGGAWADVFETEPLPDDSPLWGLPTLLVTPHNADGVEDWEARFAGLFLENLGAWREGRALRNTLG